MLGLSELKQTNVYQEALEEGRQEGKLEAIPRMINFGLNVQQISQLLDLPLEIVQKTVQQSQE